MGLHVILLATAFGITITMNIKFRNVFGINRKIERDLFIKETLRIQHLFDEFPKTKSSNWDKLCIYFSTLTLPSYMFFFIQQKLATESNILLEGLFPNQHIYKCWYTLNAYTETYNERDELVPMDFFC